MAARSTTRHTAAPSGAGYIFQLERALYHLGQAAADSLVAVEHIDDVAVLKAGKAAIVEQDKHSVRPDAQSLGDRSYALWRTLQIWLNQHIESTTCKRYLLVTNKAVSTPVARMLEGVASGKSKPTEVVKVLREADRPKSKGKKSSKLQSIIDDVLGWSDEALCGLIARVEIVHDDCGAEMRTQMANGLGIDPRVDYDIILDALLGWMTRTLQQAWRAQLPGLISRSACVRQCREIERLHARRRLLPRPARDVPVDAIDRTRAMARPFVHHLSRIQACEEDILQAVEHFIMFNTEKYRLAHEGEIVDREWRDRGDRLKQRWRNIVRSSRLEHPGWGPRQLGQRILVESTYQHLEPLGDLPCYELYMTSGHYHRLADEDEVWWDPTYQPERGR